jgi:Carboxypeptidase regulatory-like domain
MKVAEVCKTGVFTLCFLALAACAQKRITGKVNDQQGNPLSGVMVDIVLVEGRTAEIPQNGRWLTRTGDDGSFRLEVVPVKGKKIRVLAHKEGYTPRWRMVDIRDVKERLLFVLDNEATITPVPHRVGDKVEARETEWCNATIVAVGTPQSSTSQGIRDMSGMYEVRWDDWNENQWLKAESIRIRPATPTENPIKCPALTKAKLGEALMKRLRNYSGNNEAIELLVPYNSLTVYNFQAGPGSPPS